MPPAASPKRAAISLRTVLTLSVVAAAVLPFLLAGILMIVTVKQTMLRDISRRNQLIARSLAGEIERFLGEPVSLIRQIRAMTASGVLRRESDVEAYLASVLGGYHYFNRIEVLDEAGTVRYVAPPNSDFKGNSMAGQSFYQAARQSVKPYWSSTFLSFHTGAPTITLALPTEKGMIVGYLNLAVLSEIVDRIQREGGGFAAVLDAEGNALAHRDERVVNQRVNLSRDPAFRKALTREGESMSSTYGGDPFLVSAAVIDMTRWVVLVYQPERLVLAPVRNLTRIIIVGLVAAIALTLAIALISQNNILKPISMLAAQAGRIAEQDYRRSPDASTYREVEELRLAFARMAEAVARREEEMIRSEQRYRGLFEESPTPLSEQDYSRAREILDSGGLWEREALAAYLGDHPEVAARCLSRIHAVDVNRATQKLYGAEKRADLLGPIGRILPRELNAASRDMLVQLYCSGRFEIEVKNRTLQGDPLDVLVRGVCSPEHMESWGKVLVSVEDLTGRNRAAQERRDLELQLQQAQKLESIGTLAGGVAHDFNNLLMGIQGRTSLMREELGDHFPGKEHLAAIGEYVGSAAELTRQLLGFARRGKVDVRRTDINLLVEKSSKLFGRTRKQIRIFLEPARPPVVAEVDRTQLEQVLLNLFVNADQAMPGGGELRLAVDAAGLDGDQAAALNLGAGAYCRITVTDTGTGMAPEIRERIFEPFFTTKKVGRGSGLGLASSYGIMRNHGGTITVRSAPGEGSTFTLFLPATAAPAAAEAASPPEPRLTGSETVLLVDDEPLVREVAEMMLSNLGYRVLVAADGRSAIASYRERRGEIALVVLDLIMPEMGGRQVYTALKEIDPDVRVLLSSGYSIDGEASELIKNGCRGFIQKPFNLTEFGRRIRQVLGDAPAAR